MNTMKALSMITGLTLVGIVSFAQTTSRVNLTFRGATNHQVTIDGNLYSSANYSTTNSNGNRVLTIPDLALGQHTLQVLNSSNRRVGTTTTFTLRQGYDMNITINNRGGVSLNERRSSNPNTGTYKAAMTTSSFNSLIAEIRAKRGQVNKYNAANASVTRGMNYFTAAQLSQMMYQISGESYRLQLAKNAYAYLVDPTNINTVYNSLSSTASRRELQNYIATYSNTDGNPATGSVIGYAVSDATFNSLMNEVRGKWMASAKMNELVNIFNNRTYYFTSSQAKQLIALTADEANRLQLAKAAYSHIVDPANFSTIYDLLATQASRNDLDVYVRANGGTGIGSTATTYGVAMADADYNTLVEDVRGKWLPFSKMTSLRSIVNNTSYRFTASQARGLIVLENDEPNRLELAKAIMARLVDPANYSVMFDLFPTTSSRNDFEVYARNYR